MIEQSLGLHVIGHAIHGIDGQQAAGAIVKRRVGRFGQITPRHHLIVATTQSHHLQFDIVLIRPEPRRIGEWPLATHQRRGAGFSLFDGVLHGFEPNQLAVGETPRGTVAGRDDGGVGGARAIIDDDTALAQQAGRACQQIVGIDADADHDYACRIFLTVRGAHRPDAALSSHDLGHLGAEHQLNAVRTMQAGEGLGHHGCRYAGHQSRQTLEYGHLRAKFARRRRHFEADESAAHHDHAAFLLGTESDRLADGERIGNASKREHAR